MEIKDYVKQRVKQQLFYRDVYRNRYADSVKDLNKCLHKAIPIRDQQRAEILNLWSKYIQKNLPRKSFDIRWFDVYNSVNQDGEYKLKYYIPDGFYYCMVDTFFSNHYACYMMDDKNLYDLYFPDIERPKTVIRKEGIHYMTETYQLISEQEALRLCNQFEKVIIKPSVSSCGGKGICYWSGGGNIKILADILRKYDSAVVQECVTPHHLFQEINKDCLSTLRIVTLLFEGEVHAVSSVCIMGGEGAKTNHLHSGGLVCGIKDDGWMKKAAYNGNGDCFYKHPNGIVFAETNIPGFKDCVSMAKALAPRLSRITKLIGWDFTIGKNGEPILIEANMTWGGLCQIANGPIFGDMTEKVLDFVSSNSSYFK